MIFINKLQIKLFLILTSLSFCNTLAQVTLTNKGLEVQYTSELGGVILPNIEDDDFNKLDKKAGLIFFHKDNIKGVVSKNINGESVEVETLTSTPETSRLFKSLELNGNAPYLKFNCGFSNTDKNPLVKDQIGSGFRPWSLAIKFKPGAKDGTNPILSLTDDEARRGIYLQLEQNQLVLHFGDYNTNPCTGDVSQCKSYVTWRSNINFSPHMWQKVLITFSPKDPKLVTKGDIIIYTTMNGELKKISDQEQFTQIGGGYDGNTPGELYIGLSKVDNGNGAVRNYFKGDLNYVMLLPFSIGKKDKENEEDDGNIIKIGTAETLNNPVEWVVTHKNQIGIKKNGDQIDYLNTSNLWLMGNGTYDSANKIVNSLDFKQESEALELILIDN